MPTSIAGLAILTHQVGPNAILLCPGPRLSQLQMVDLTVCLGCLEPPPAKTTLHSSRLHLLFKEINLAAQRLTLFVHRMVSIDFGHETPVVDGEFVEFSTQCGKCCATPPERRYEP